MIRIESIAAGIGTLRANPMRTVLSTLGVIIGVASLVAILALGDGLEQYSRSQIEQTTDLQFITVEPRLIDFVEGMRVRRAEPAVLTTAHVDSLAAALSETADVARALTASDWTRFEGDTARRATLVTATTPSLQLLQGLEMVAGRFLGDGASRYTPVVVRAGHGQARGVADSLLPGRVLFIGTVPHTIVGVVAGGRGPAQVYVPLDSAAEALYGENGRTAATVMIRVRDVVRVEAVLAGVQRWLGERWRPAEQHFQIQSQSRRAAQARQAFFVFKLVMGSITGISILVGGIGIMNILLASVAERTREIGIRKAVGARRRDIMVQFLAESVAISGVGALLGVILGLGGAFGITAVIRRATEAQMHAAFTWGTVLVAGAAAIIVGIVFGTYPARRAAGLDPIEAIRHE